MSALLEIFAKKKAERADTVTVGGMRRTLPDPERRGFAIDHLKQSRGVNRRKKKKRKMQETTMKCEGVRDVSTVAHWVASQGMSMEGQGHRHGMGRWRGAR